VETSFSLFVAEPSHEKGMLAMLLVASGMTQGEATVLSALRSIGGSSTLSASNNALTLVFGSPAAVHALNRTVASSPMGLWSAKSKNIGLPHNDRRAAEVYTVQLLGASSRQSEGQGWRSE
jgi:hypothetical protein